MPDKNNANDLSVSQHVVYICSRLLAYGLPLLFFLVTTSFYLKTYDSAQIKITLTQIGGATLLIIWVVRLLVEGRLPFTKSDFVFVAPFVAFLASGLISYAHTPFKGWALEETSRRIFYMVFALIAVAEFRSDERMKRLWRYLFAAAWVTIGYGFLQFLDTRFFEMTQPGIDPFIWRQAFTARVFSTFGNPNFYGNFLVILTPLILASVLRWKASLIRPFVLIAITLGILFFIDKMTGRMWSGTFDPSYRVVFSAMIVILLGAFVFATVWKVGDSAHISLSLLLFALLFLNLYSTETKGAWLGFMTAIAATLILILEYFLHLEERLVEPKKYLTYLAILIGLLVSVLGFMVMSFVMPLFTDSYKQSGYTILWIPTALGILVSTLLILWAIKKPWNVKKLVYGALVLFVLAMGGGVLEYAKARLLSVSFRLFTWISTVEMIRTEPIFGNGVGTFKVVYPAYRRPEIIVLEAKSNTETDHAEDEYLEVWQDEGIIGFGIFLWLIVTALVCGFKQLRWYSNIRAPDKVGKRKLLDIDNDPRSYEVLGFLGAWIGALLHWCMDVSIRFVSSGIFSGLLPGVLVAYARNHGNPIRNEVRLWYERWIRIGWAGFWTMIMLWLRMELVPQTFIQGGDTQDWQIVTCIVIVGAALFLMMEMLESGNQPEKVVPFSEQYPPVSSNLWIPRLALLAVGLAGFGISVNSFRDQFLADVHHNLAIFFSKQAIWKKAPIYDAKMNSFPPDIRKNYQNYGGALEHYQEVIKKNPYFPMAQYFTGNVYNDWGTQYNNDSLAARDKKDMPEALRLRQKTLDMWNQSEEAYVETKKLAPNYVQTHHQMGILYTKRAEQSMQWGEMDKAKEYYAIALENFRKYKMLDPVFPPNYDRIVQILLMDRKYKEIEDLYKEAIYYNHDVSVFIRSRPFDDRLGQLYSSLAKVYFTEAKEKSPDPFHPLLPEVTLAAENFEKATQSEPTNVEAWKGLGFILDKMGRHQEAQAALRKALEVNPNDPELRAGPHP